MKAGKRIWQVAWRLVVCALLLAWIFHAIFVKEAQQSLGPAWQQLAWTEIWQRGAQELWRTLRLVDAGAFLTSIVLMGVTLPLGALRWRLALRVQGLDLPLSRTLEISFVAHFFNSFLLGSTGGDLMKAYYAARETHHKKTEAIVTVFVDRLIGLWAMLLFAGLMMLPNLRLLQEHDRLLAVACLILAMLCACSLLVSLGFWGGISRRWPGAREWLHRLPRSERLERTLESCRQYGRERAYLWRALALSMGLNVMCVLQVMALARGLNLSIAPLALFVVVPIIICISALPITPSGLGVRENLFVLMLAAPQINVPATSALSLSLLAYGGSLFWSLVGGVVYLSLKERHHLAEAAEENDLESGARVN